MILSQFDQIYPTTPNCAAGAGGDNSAAILPPQPELANILNTDTNLRESNSDILTFTPTV